MIDGTRVEAEVDVGGGRHGVGRGEHQQAAGRPAARPGGGRAGSTVGRRHGGRRARSRAGGRRRPCRGPARGAQEQPVALDRRVGSSVVLAAGCSRRDRRAGDGPAERLGGAGGASRWAISPSRGPGTIPAATRSRKDGEERLVRRLGPGVGPTGQHDAPRRRRVAASSATSRVLPAPGAPVTRTKRRPPAATRAPERFEAGQLVASGRRAAGNGQRGPRGRRHGSRSGTVDRRVRRTDLRRPCTARGGCGPVHRHASVASRGGGGEHLGHAQLGRDGDDIGEQAAPPARRNRRRRAADRAIAHWSRADRSPRSCPCGVGGGDGGLEPGVGLVPPGERGRQAADGAPPPARRCWPGRAAHCDSYGRSCVEQAGRGHGVAEPEGDHGG